MPEDIPPVKTFAEATRHLRNHHERIAECEEVTKTVNKLWGSFKIGAPVILGMLVANVNENSILGRLLLWLQQTIA